MPSDQDLFQQSAGTIAEDNCDLRVEPIFDGELPCVLVYSEQPGGGYLYPLISQLESVLREKGFRPGRASSAKNQGNNPKAFEKALANCILGVVILDGFKPNTIYQLGQLIGRKKPVILLHSENVPVAVKSYYPSSETSGLDPQIFDHKLKEPALDWNFHLGNLGGITPTPIDCQAPKTGSLHPIVALKRGLESNTTQIMDSILNLITQKLPREAVPEMAAPLEVMIKSYYSRSLPVSQNLSLTDFETAVLQLKNLAQKYRTPIPDPVVSIIAAVYLAKARELPWQAVEQRINCLNAALGAYRDRWEEVSSNIGNQTPEQLFLQADLQKKIGYTCLELARYQEMDSNCHQAVQANLAALEFFSREVFPTDFATAQHNLGVAYFGLAAVKERVHYLELAQAAFAKSLEVYTLEAFPLNYAIACYNSGQVSSALGKSGGSSEEFKSATAAYQESLKVSTVDNFPNLFALAQRNLGETYFNLGSLESEPNGSARDHFRLAIKALEAALQVWNLENMPLQYANLYQLMGDIFLKMAETEPEVWYYQKAISAYREAGKVRDQFKFRREYGLTQNNLGNAYFRLADTTNQLENYREAIEAYQEALRVFTFEIDSIRYALIQHYLCRCFYHLATAPEGVVVKARASAAASSEPGAPSGTDSEARAGYQKVIHAAKEALRILSLETPGPYQITMRYLGAAYVHMGELKRDGTDYRNAIAVYLELLDSIAEAKTYNTRIASESIPEAGRIQDLTEVCYPGSGQSLEFTQVWYPRHGESEESTKVWYPKHGESEGFTAAGYPGELIQKEVGDAYLNLAELEPEGNHYPSAIDAYQKALVHYTQAEYPADFARIWYNLGEAYRNLAEKLADAVVERGVNCELAVTAYENAMLVYLPERYPTEYATIRRHLGAIYRILAETTNKSANYRLAIENFRKALRIGAAKIGTGDLGEDVSRNAPSAKTAEIRQNLGEILLKLAEIEDTAANCREAITVFGEALEYYTQGATPENYALLQNSLGAAWRKLGETEGKAEHIRKAIQAYQAALEIYNTTEFPFEFAATWKDVGIAYGILSTWEDRIENCKKSINAFKVSLTIYIREDRPLDYAVIQDCLGNAYSILAETEDQAENYKRAAEAYEAVVSIYSTDRCPIYPLPGGRLPLDYARAKLNLGAAFTRLAEVKGDSEIYHQAINAYEDALNLYTIKQLPLEYITAQNNLGAAYQRLALEAVAPNTGAGAPKIGAGAPNVGTGASKTGSGSQVSGAGISKTGLGGGVYYCQKATAAYQEALQIATLESYPLFYGATQKNLGEAYALWAKLEEPLWNWQKSLWAFHEALKVYTNNHPIQHSALQQQLGTVYCHLADLEEPLENYQAAIQCYQAALKIRTTDSSPAQAAAIQVLLGNCYLQMARRESNGAALYNEKAIITYLEALQFYGLASFPENYAAIQVNLGQAYSGLAHFEARARNCEKAIQSYREALQVKLPSQSIPGAPNLAGVYRELGDVYLMLAETETVPGTQAAPKTYQDAILAYENAIKIYQRENLIEFAQLKAKTGDLRVKLAELASVASDASYAGGDVGEVDCASITGDASLSGDTSLSGDANVAATNTQITNLLQAVADYQDAANILNLDNFSGQYGELQAKLGATHGKLKDLVQLQAHCRSAIHHYKEALGVYRLDTEPLQYAALSSSLGAIYQALACACQISGGACQISGGPCQISGGARESLDDTREVSGATREISGAAREIQSDACETLTNTHLAIAAFQEALRIYDLEKYPAQYAQNQFQLASAYETLARMNASSSEVSASEEDEASRKTAASPGDAQGIVTYYSLAIHGYEESLKINTWERFPLHYGAIWQNLIRIYHELAAITDPGANSIKTILACKEVLRVRTLESFPLEYAFACDISGSAYTRLAVIKDPESNRLKAIECYQKALQVYTLERSPEDYARIQYQVGDLYRLLMESERRTSADPRSGADPQSSSKHQIPALNAYQEALKVYTLESFPIQYGAIQGYLGTIQASLSEEGLRSSIDAFQKALNVHEKAFGGNIASPDCQSMTRYMYTLLNLGAACLKLARIEHPQENYQRAIKTYQEVLRLAPRDFSYTRKDNYAHGAFAHGALAQGAFAQEAYAPSDDNAEFDPAWVHGSAQRYLGLAYLKLADLAASQTLALENLEQSIRHSREALQIRTREMAPFEYAVTQTQLGHAFYQSALIENVAANCEQTITAYEAALTVYQNEPVLENARREEPFMGLPGGTVDIPRERAEVLHHLGLVYYLLASVDHKFARLQSALHYLEEALKVRTLEYLPFDYADSQQHLGDVYHQLAEGADPVTNYQLALESYLEALKVITQSSSPLEYAELQYHFGYTCLKIALLEEPAVNYRKAVVAFSEALKVLSPENHPENFIETQYELGNAYCRLAEIEGKAENSRRGIKAYREALKLNIPDPLQYGALQDQLGTAYMIQAESEERLENSKKALTAFKEALNIYLKEERTFDYALTQQKIGTSFFNLAELENKAENCKKALETFKEALRVFTLEAYPVQYADCQHKLADVYLRLAEVENSVINYKRGITAYEEALQVRTFASYPVEYAKTYQCLGTAFSKLAEVEDKAENYSHAVLNYSNTLKVYTIGDFPMQYAAIQKQIGIAYTALADFHDKAGNCAQAVAALKNALKVYVKESFAEEYALTQNSLGNAYRKLADVEDKGNNYNHAIVSYEEVIKIYSNNERFPTNIAAIQSNLGAAYRMLAEIKDTPGNCQNAIKAYENALKVYTVKNQPHEYALILHDLGAVFHLLAGVNHDPEDCKKALEKYKEALKINTLQAYPLQYAINHRDLGLAYHTLSLLEDSALRADALKNRADALKDRTGALKERTTFGETALKERAENCKRSISAFQEALKVYRIKIPSQQAQVQYHLGAVYLTLAEVEEPLDNYRRSLENYNEAARFFTPDSFPVQYAHTQFQLGQVYFQMAGLEDPARNYHLAIHSFQEVLPIWTLEKTPADFARVNEQLGHTFQELARYESGYDCLENALTAYEETLKVYTLQNQPESEGKTDANASSEAKTEANASVTYAYAYAATHRNLGSVYTKLAELDDKIGNCRKAIRALKEALKIFTVERYPADYTDILNRLGAIYITLAGEEDQGDSYQKAVEVYESILNLSGRAQSLGVNIDYPGTLIKLGTVYRRLAEVKEPSENAQKAIKAFEDALKDASIRHNPNEHLMINQNLGAAYFILAGTGPNSRSRIHNGKKAVQYLKEVQKGVTGERYPQIFGSTQTDLAKIYCFLAGQENKLDHLKLAIAAAKKSLEVYSFEDYPLEYAAAYKTLGQIYKDLAGLEDREANYKLAVEAYREALRIYMRENLIVECAQVQNELGNLNSLIASTAGDASSYKNAITSYEEALKVQTLEIAPLQYASSKSSLGNEYLKLADFEDLESNCRQAIQSFTDALEIYKPDRFPEDYTNIQTKLGHTYLKLAQSLRAAASSPSRAQESELEPGSKASPPTGALETVEYCKKAIIAYESALQGARKEKPPLEYAAILQYLGATHLTLAHSGESAVESYQNAITVLKTARNYLRKTPNRYLQLETELGNAYLSLGEIQETYLNCRRALRSFQNALKKVPFKRSSTQYPALLNNYGNAYSILAGITGKPSDHQQVIKIYQEVLQIGALRSLPSQTGIAHLKLGAAYFALAVAKDELELYKTAANAYEEAFKTLPLPSTPSNLSQLSIAADESGASNIPEIDSVIGAYLVSETPDTPYGRAAAQFNLGRAYYILAGGGTGAAGNKITQAAYQELVHSGAARDLSGAAPDLSGASIQILSLADLEPFNADTGSQSLSAIDSKMNYCNRAIEAFTEALKTYSPVKDPLKYAAAQMNLGNAYFRLTGVDYRALNLYQAIEAYQNALAILNPEFFALQYANTQTNLGNVYIQLAKLEDLPGNCRQAVLAYEAALQVYTLEHFPVNYAITQDNLRNTYSMLAEVDGALETYKLTFDACAAALQVFTRRRFPRKYRSLKYEEESLVKLLIYQ